MIHRCWLLNLDNGSHDKRIRKSVRNVQKIPSYFIYMPTHQQDYTTLGIQKKLASKRSRNRFKTWLYNEKFGTRSENLWYAYQMTENSNLTHDHSLQFRKMGQRLCYRTPLQRCNQLSVAQLSSHFYETWSNTRTQWNKRNLDLVAAHEVRRFPDSRIEKISTHGECADKPKLSQPRNRKFGKRRLWRLLKSSSPDQCSASWTR